MWYLLPLLTSALELDYGLSCPVINCLNATATVNHACKTELDSGTIDLTPCSIPFYCPISESVKNSTCDYWPSYKQDSYPGEPCNTDSQCQYGYCRDGNICVGKRFNQTCTMDDECDPGLYCADTGKTCLNLINPGSSETCTNDYQCSNLAGCHNGRCT